MVVNQSAKRTHRLVKEDFLGQAAPGREGDGPDANAGAFHAQGTLSCLSSAYFSVLVGIAAPGVQKQLGHFRCSAW